MLTKKDIENALKGLDYDKIAKRVLADIILVLQEKVVTNINTTQLRGGNAITTNGAGTLSIPFNVSMFPDQNNNPYYNLSDPSKIIIPYDGTYSLTITASLNDDGLQPQTHITLYRTRDNITVPLAFRNITSKTQGCLLLWSDQFIKNDTITVNIEGGIPNKNLFRRADSPIIFIQKQI